MGLGIHRNSGWSALYSEKPNPEAQCRSLEALGSSPGRSTPSFLLGCLVMLFLSLISGGVGRTETTARGALSISQLSTRSDLIVLGTVVSIRWHSTVNNIFTQIDLNVEEVLKGPDAETVSFYQLGGQVGDITSSVAGVPVFTAGEKVLVFLSVKREPRPTLVGLFQGKLTIEKDPVSEKEVAIRRIPGVAKPLDQMSLERVKELIQKNAKE